MNIATILTHLPRWINWILDSSTQRNHVLEGVHIRHPIYWRTLYESTSYIGHNVTYWDSIEHCPDHTIVVFVSSYHHQQTYDIVAIVMIMFNMTTAL